MSIEASLKCPTVIELCNITGYCDEKSISSIVGSHLDIMQRNGRVESCNATTGEEESVDPLLSSLDNSRLTQLGSFISTDQVN